MARYIDADALIKLLQKNMSNDIQDRIITENNINLIQSMPTAYDVDAVVEQFEEKQIDISGNESLNYFYSEGYCDAIDCLIDIVRNAGKEGAE